MIAGSKYILLMDWGTDVGIGFTIEMLSPGATEFVILPKEITLPTYTDRGYYNFTIPAEHTKSVGRYLFIAIEDGTGISDSKEIDCYPAPIHTDPTFNKCIITGNVRDIAGDVDLDDQSFITAMPIRLPNPSSSTFLSGKRIKTLSDYNGNFSMPLIIGIEAVFEIKEAGVRFQATVPDLPTVNLKDLMPTE